MERSYRDLRKLSAVEGGYYGTSPRPGNLSSHGATSRQGRYSRMGCTSRQGAVVSSDPLQNLLAKQPDDRKQKDIERSRASAKKLSNLLAHMDNDIIDHALKNVLLEKYTMNQIIVKEGDTGDRFYIMMSGSASVYTYTCHQPCNKTPEMEEEGREDETEHPPLDELTKEETELILEKTKNRDILGKFDSTLEPGFYFGELALLSQDGMRNASVVADCDCNILVFNSNLYNKTIRIQQTIEFQRKNNFVSSHPYFCNLAERCRHQFQVSLEHKTFGLGDDIITQATPSNRIFFIISGEARIITETVRHKRQLCTEVSYQTNNMNVDNEDEDDTKDEKPKIIERRLVHSAYSSRGRNQDSMPLPHISDAVALRRISGYVAAERKSFDRLIDLCFVRTGEVLGDIEYLTGLGTYLFTVKCTSECEVYCVPIRTLDRIVIRKNPQTLEAMRWSAETKLSMRMSTEQGKKISVLSTLLSRLRQSRPAKLSGRYATDTTRKSNDFAMPYPSKPQGVRPPNQWAQVRQITRLFVENKVPLLVPCTDGAVYFRQLSQKRAQIRAEQRELQQKDSQKDFPSVQRQLSDAKIENHRDTLLYEKKRQRLMSKGNIEEIDINKWK